MLIVCTQDAAIINFTQSAASNAALWGNVYYLTPGLSWQQATAQFNQFLGLLADNEPLCLSAHGNNNLIGDEGDGPDDWEWDYTYTASMLKNSCPNASGPILMHVCSTEIANFSTNVVVALEGFQGLNGVWIYGYNEPIDTNLPYPNPAELDANPGDEFQAAQVVWQ